MKNIININKIVIGMLMIPVMLLSTASVVSAGGSLQKTYSNYGSKSRVKTYSNYGSKSRAKSYSSYGHKTKTKSYSNYGSKSKTKTYSNYGSSKSLGKTYSNYGSTTRAKSYSNYGSSKPKVKTYSNYGHKTKTKSKYINYGSKTKTKTYSNYGYKTKAKTYSNYGSKTKTKTYSKYGKFVPSKVVYDYDDHSTSVTYNTPVVIDYNEPPTYNPPVYEPPVYNPPVYEPPVIVYPPAPTYPTATPINIVNNNVNNNVNTNTVTPAPVAVTPVYPVYHPPTTVSTPQCSMYATPSRYNGAKVTLSWATSLGDTTDVYCTGGVLGNSRVSAIGTRSIYPQSNTTCYAIVRDTSTGASKTCNVYIPVQNKQIYTPTYTNPTVTLTSSVVPTYKTVTLSDAPYTGFDDPIWLALYAVLALSALYALYAQGGNILTILGLDSRRRRLYRV